MKNKLKQFYNNIENTSDYSVGLFNYSVSKELKNIRDNANSSNISKIAQLEMDCFNFNIKNGELEPFFKSVNPETNEDVFKIPNIETFDEESYNYIKNRIKNTQNPIIISRYAMILWDGKREYEYAKLAVDENLKIISKLKTILSDLNSLTNYIINTYVISKKINYKNREVKDILLNLIKDQKLNKLKYFNLQYDLIEFIINQQKNFRKDFKDIDIHAWKLAEDLKTKDDHLLIRVIELGEKINNICSIKDDKWTELKSETYEKLAKQEESFLKLYYLENAINLNKKLNRKSSKIEKLIKEHDDYRKKLEFNEIVLELPELSEIILKVEKEAKKMCKEDPETIITHLMNNNDLLVGNNELLTNLNPTSKFIDLFGVELFDENIHKIKTYKNEKEKERFKLLESYNFYNLISNRYLNKLLSCSINNKKISRDILINFIKGKTWIGKTEQNDTLIIINQYFKEYFTHLDHLENSPDFILAMNSLILIMEKIIRTFCEICNISTTHFKKNTNEEKSLNQLLKEEKLEEKIGKDDLFFLKFILVDQDGLNLRNKIAHQLLKPSDYNVTNANLLILVLFRLLKHEI